MTCGIYKITNLINNKIYIGKSVNIQKRWNQHKNAKDSSPIHLAIQKYGINNFVIDILEECSRDELDQKEKYWIQKYNSCFGDGYNATIGGDGSSHSVKLSHEELLKIIDLLQNSKETFSEIGKKFGVSSTTISQINIGESRVLSDLIYPIRKNRFDKRKIDKDPLSILLEQTKGDYNYIANFYNVSYVTIKNLCKEYGFSTIRSDYGYIDEQSYHSQKILQCDKDTQNLIKEYPSIRGAAREMGVNPNSIGKALTSKTHLSSGYYWKKGDNDAITREH